MININTEIKLPKTVNWYALLKLLILILFLSVPLGAIFKSASSILALSIFLGVLFLPILVIVLFVFKNVSFSLNENNITIKSGILSKHSSTIPYASIQNIDCVTGPLMRLLHLTKLNIWTSSSAQLVIKNGKTNNEPIGLLILMKEDAEWIKSHILNKRETAPRENILK